MSPDASAYRTLGLQPGADAAAVEAAYRQLIKRYHPDRTGGDPARAAEINRAYQQIRKARRLPAARRTAYPVVQPGVRRKRRTGGRLLGLGLALGVVALVVTRSDVELSLGEFAEPRLQADSSPSSASARAISEGLGEPLDSGAIDRSVLSASRLARQGELDRVSSQSRRCHEELRQNPTLSRLDQCVAFDEAVVVLTRDDRLQDGGPFSASAVTGRQLRAARLFSDDYLMLESRLDRIRAQVEFSLAPPDPRPSPPLEF